MRISIAFARILALLTLGLASAIAQNAPLLPDTELSAESGRINVKVLVTPFPGAQTCKAASSWRWGAENACPNAVIGSVELRVNAELVFVPISAFADLGNPRVVQIDQRKGKDRFAVILVGGDAATSYKATLEFQKNILLERVVRHGEFPAESWERTIYKFNR